MRDLGGRRIVITGANTGIGRAAALELAARGAALVLLGRDEPRTRPVLEAIRTAGGAASFVALDLASLASVRRAAEDLLADPAPIHVLINNAGLAGQRGLTADGFELAFGVNHLGHFLLTRLLEPRLRASAPARVVAVASRAHADARRIDWDALRRPTATRTGWTEYRVSKLCNVLHMAELGRQLDGSGVTTYAVHPGVIGSDLFRRLPAILRVPFVATLRTPAQGARSTVRAATAPELLRESGRYYGADGEATPASLLGRDPALAAELWRRSLEMIDGT